MKRRIMLVTLVYLAVLTHFLISNFYSLIGPNYTLPMNATSSPKLTQQQIEEMDMPLCPNVSFANPTGMSDTSRPKGFPVATNNTCGADSGNFIYAWVLDGAYITLVTVLAGFVIWGVRKT